MAATALGNAKRDARASEVVAKLNDSWTAGAPDESLTGASQQARLWASTVRRNLKALGVENVWLRFVGRSAPSKQSPEGWLVGEVEVRWTPEDGADPSRVIVSLRFDAAGFPVGEADTTPTAEPFPVWLSGRLQVVHERGVTLIGVRHNPDFDKVRLITVRAARDVRAALPRRQPVVTVVVPPNAETASRLLGSTRHDLAGIAAVTATVDGSDHRYTPVHVVLNAPIFDALGRRAAQFVLTHELTHATTGATTSSMPLWAAEGFADYVALHDSRLPLGVAVGQALSRVGRSGVPRALPSDSDFAAQGSGLGRAYEEAWLVFRMLAERYGHAATVKLYLRIRDGGSLHRALGVLGLNVTSLTAAWRDYLEYLAAASN